MGLTAWLFHVIRKGEIGNDTRTGKRTHITKNKRTHKKRTRGGSWSSPLSHRDDESPDTRGREGLIFLEQGRGWAVENGFRRQQLLGGAPQSLGQLLVDGVGQVAG